MTEEFIKKIITDTVAECRKIENGFFIAPEAHYNQHKFLENLIKWSEGTTSIIGKTIAGLAVTGIVSLVVWGFIAWGCKSIKG